MSILLISTSTFAAGLAAMAAGSALYRRVTQARQDAAQTAPVTSIDQLSPAMVDQLAEALSSRMTTSKPSELARLNDTVTAMQQDFEWLVSDRMIEQAVAMAREGVEGERISQTSGMSVDELKAAMMFRTH